MSAARRPARPQPAPDTVGESVVAWQRAHGRSGLPWQQQRDPYRVWLSEIMLQQTQVTTVLDYYPRFLARFPDVAALAAAPLDAVLARWSGLGYYSRARNLHRCAQVVLADHGGRFPADAEALSQLPGIGRSTAAAIAAFCFDQRAAILDGNVKRVLTRLLGFGEDLAIAAHERRLWQHACGLLPADGADMPAYTQGLMDLGATVCLAKRPNCLLCPLAEACVARREGRPEAYPVKTRKLKRTRREHAWLWLEHVGTVWLQQRPATGVWSGLWSLPLFDDDDALHAAAAALGAQPETLPPIDHALTHFDWRLRPFRAALPAAADPSVVLGAGRWIALDALDGVGLPAPLRKLLLSRPAT
ncbi:MAG TPA: A/G-specific adenine glycosylase [Methylibium sp.]|nr:A/G-specific adenine glycosylase [Methylibium sp.]